MARHNPLSDGFYLSFEDPESGVPSFRQIQPTSGTALGLQPAEHAAPSQEAQASHAADEDMILFAMRAEACSPTSAAQGPASEQVNLVLVVDGQPMKARLDSEQAVALGVGLLLANPDKLQDWLRGAGEEAPLPEAS